MTEPGAAVVIASLMNQSSESRIRPTRAIVADVEVGYRRIAQVRGRTRVRLSEDKDDNEDEIGTGVACCPQFSRRVLIGLADRHTGTRG